MRIDTFSKALRVVGVAAALGCGAFAQEAPMGMDAGPDLGGVGPSMGAGADALGGAGMQDAGFEGGAPASGGFQSFANAGRQFASNVWDQSLPGAAWNAMATPGVVDRVQGGWDAVQQGWDTAGQLNQAQNRFRQAFEGQEVNFFPPQPQQGGGWVVGGQVVYNPEVPQLFAGLARDAGMPAVQQGAEGAVRDLRFLEGKPVSMYMGLGKDRPINAMRLEFGGNPGVQDTLPDGFSARFHPDALGGMIAQGAADGPGGIRMPISKGRMSGTLVGNPGMPQLAGDHIEVPTSGRVSLSNHRPLFRVDASGTSSGKISIEDLRVNPETQVVEFDVRGQMVNHDPSVRIGPNGGIRLRPSADSQMVKNQARDLIPKYTQRVFANLNQDLSDRSEYLSLDRPTVRTDGHFTRFDTTGRMDVGRALDHWFPDNQVRLDQVRLQDNTLDIQGSGLLPTLTSQMRP